MPAIDSLHPARLDFEPLKRGDTFPARPLAILSRDGSAVAVASAILQVRTRLRGVLAAEWNSSNSSVLITGSPVANTITLAAKLSSETNYWPVGTHDYDLQITLADGAVITLFKGDFPVARDTSH